MGLWTLHNGCVSCLLDYLKSQLYSKGRLHISEFSDSLCLFYVYLTFKFRLTHIA